MQMNIKDILKFAADNRRLIVIPTVVCTLLAIVYAVLRPARWEAAQALFVRDASIGALTRGGRFESVDAMQTAQETMLEICRHPEVLRTVLEEVGPDSFWRQEPNAYDIDALQKKVNVAAPNGAQFGRTEMVYLSVEDRTVERAMELTDSLTRKLIDRMQRLRTERYDGIVRELEKSVEVGRAKLDDATQRLVAMEKQVGSDIAELRVLMDQGQGDGNVRRALSEIEAEIRVAEAQLNAKSNQYKQLIEAAKDPRQLVSMPSAALDSQPTLFRLKEGLVAAQLNTSQIMGVKSGRHPDVQAAIKAEDRIRRQLHHELSVAVRNLSSDIKTAKQTVDSLKGYRESAAGRMGGLASMRTTYSNLTTEVQQRVTFLEEAERNLAVARSNKASAESVSLIQRVEQPVAGIQPLGLGRKSIVLGGLLGGVGLGLGLLFLTYPIEDKQTPSGAYDGKSERRGRSWGRRATDRFWEAIGSSLYQSAQPHKTERRRNPLAQTANHEAKSARQQDGGENVVIQVRNSPPIIFGKEAFGDSPSSVHNN